MPNNQNGTANIKCDDTNNCTACNSSKCNGHSLITNSQRNNEDNVNLEDMNIVEIGLDAKFCYVCDSADDPNCESRLNSSMLERCPTSELDLGCFHVINGKLLSEI